MTHFPEFIKTAAPYYEEEHYNVEDFSNLKNQRSSIWSRKRDIFVGLIFYALTGIFLVAVLLAPSYTSLFILPFGYIVQLDLSLHRVFIQTNRLFSKPIFPYKSESTDLLVTLLVDGFHGKTIHDAAIWVCNIDATLLVRQLGCSELTLLSFSSGLTVWLCTITLMIICINFILLLAILYQEKFVPNPSRIIRDSIIYLSMIPTVCMLFATFFYVYLGSRNSWIDTTTFLRRRMPTASLSAMGLGVGYLFLCAASIWCTALPIVSYRLLYIPVTLQDKMLLDDTALYESLFGNDSVLERMH